MKNDIEKIKEIRGEVPKENERFVELKPETKADINSWREIINDNFPDLVLPAEIGASVIAQLLIEDIKNPFSLVYVDVPSSGKTIALNFFSKINELIYATDNFTPASFVSHSANTKREQLGKNDMLPQIRYKVLMVRDLAPIFAKKDENVQEMLGILIRVLDGEGLETNSGLHGKRGYVGDYLFMMLSASTTIRPRIWKAMGNLGSRLFFVNIDGKKKDIPTLAKQLKNSCKEKELLCRDVTENFIKTIWSKNLNGITWDKETDELHYLEIIANFADILARLRSALNVWEDQIGSKKYNHTQPITEMPDRLVQLLYNLARGHSVICGRKKINEEDLQIVRRVALDSAPPNRSKIFKHLILNKGRLKTSDIEKIINCSKTMALIRMQELEILEIVETDGNMKDDTINLGGRPEQEIILKDDFKWFISEEYKDLFHKGKNAL